MCKPCEHFIPTGREQGRCGLCGCKLNISGKLSKIRWATESCPAGKWTSHIAVAEGTQLTARQLRRQKRLERRQRRLERAKRKGEQHVHSRRRDAPPLVELPENTDPLEVFDTKKQPIGHVLRDLWSPCPGFLVCGGPSLKNIDVSLLRHRGVCSLGVNNVAGYVPVSAFLCGDPPEKFHHGIWLDPKILKFVPTTKLYKRVRAKKPDGEFVYTRFNVSQCPSVFGFRRIGTFEPDKFLTTPGATWGTDKTGVRITNRPKILFSFFMGLRLLHYLGCPRIYLLGVDFNMDEQNKYAFGQNRTKGAQNGNNNSYRIAAKMCEELRPVLDAAGWQIFNCNPTSHLAAFDYVPFEEALRDCKQFVPDEPFDLAGWYEKPGADTDDRGTS